MAEPLHQPQGRPWTQSPVVAGNDWTRRDELPSEPSPRSQTEDRRGPRGGGSDIVALEEISSSSSSTASPTAAARRRRRRRRQDQQNPSGGYSPSTATARQPRPPSSSMSMRTAGTSRAASAAPSPGQVLSRSATAPAAVAAHRWPQYIYEEEADNSRSDSRRSLGSRGRDASPHLYRSMAGSRRSSRTSLSVESVDDSEEETQDEELETKSSRGKKLVHASAVKHDVPPKVPKPPKRRDDIIYEEDQPCVRERSRSRHPPRRDVAMEETIYVEDCGRDRRGESRPRPRREEIVYDVDYDKEPPPKPRRGEVIYEEDCERTKYNPFLDGPRPRSRSRAPSSPRHEVHRREGKEPTRRSTADDSLSRSRSRSKRLTGRYYETEVAYRDSRPSSSRKSHAMAGSAITSSQSVGSSARRSSSFLGTFFGPALHAGHSGGPDRPIKLVPCVICMEDIPSPRAAKLKCGHRMCEGCLKESFKLSVRDPQHMPPKCCTADHIPVKHVDRLFDTAFKRRWNRKYAEFSTRNRIYCPSRKCGEWIKPEQVHRDADGRKYAKCGRCHTKVCYRCNGKWHSSRDCPRDEETHRFLEQAKQLGWQRCHSCRAVVELKEGCNHMTCRCGAEFCMICGNKWKTCDCPWFNHDALETDHLDHMQIPMNIRGEHLSMRGPEAFGIEQHSSPRDFYRPGSIPAPAAARPRPQSYEEEMLLRRLQEQRDEQQHQSTRYRRRAFERYVEDHDDEDDDYQGRIGEMHGIGNTAGHFMNDDYRRRPETVIVPPSPHTAPGGGGHQHQQHSSYDRTTSGGTDYISGVHRARGMRASSMERRLAERFNSELRGSPGHRSTGPPVLTSAATMPIMPHSMTMSMGGPMVHPAGITPVRRRHTMEEEMYASTHHSSPRSAPRPGSGHRTKLHHRDDDFTVEVPSPAPLARRSVRQKLREGGGRGRDGEVPDSTLAGLTGPGRGMGRVGEWVNYIEPGLPEDAVERASTVSS